MRSVHGLATGTALLALLVGGCALVELECEDLSAMVDGEEGLVVVEAEHPTGWGEDRCMTCHSSERMHVMNCTGLPEVDIQAIRALVEEQGEACCADCHGANGVEP